MVHRASVEALVNRIEINLIAVVGLIGVAGTSNVVNANLVVESLRQVVSHEIVKHVVLARALIGTKLVFV